MSRLLFISTILFTVIGIFQVKEAKTESLNSEIVQSQNIFGFINSYNFRPCSFWSYESSVRGYICSMTDMMVNVPDSHDVSSVFRDLESQVLSLEERVKKLEEKIKDKIDKKD